MLTQDAHLKSIICLAHRIEAMANKLIFMPMGMSSSSMKILSLIYHEKSVTPGKVLESTGLTKSNISQRLNFLEKEGYIQRGYASNQKDKRLIQIILTKKGREKLYEMHALIEKAKISIEQKLSKQELANHEKFILKLNSLLDEEENNIKQIFNQ